MNAHDNLLHDLEPVETRALARPQSELDLAWIAERAALIAALPPVKDRSAIRERLGVSVSELARTIDSSRQFVRDVEMGKAIPKGRHLKRLAAFYNAASGGSARDRGDHGRR